VDDHGAARRQTFHEVTASIGRRSARRTLSPRMKSVGMRAPRPAALRPDGPPADGKVTVSDANGLTTLRQHAATGLPSTDVLVEWETEMRDR
jgi:hypothetical protein